MSRLQKTKATWMAGILAITSVWLSVSTETKAADEKAKPEAKMDKMEVATLGGGCFWCVEGVLQQIDGIESVKSGYMGGKSENPTYEEICDKSRNTGHIEVVQVTYDPKKINFDLLLDAFWLIHDPTSKDQQGADIGIQYRSIIFYHDDLQKKAAEASIAKANASGKFTKKLVTEVREIEKFWDAEGYHQNYYKNNPANGYCNALIPPKLYKLFADAKFEKKRKSE